MIGTRARSVLRKLAVVPIDFYRYFISPLFPAHCRYHPTCSAYARDAVLGHGLLKGGFMAVFRILRCHPWSAGGYDPVPAPRIRCTRKFIEHPHGK